MNKLTRFIAAALLISAAAMLAYGYNASRSGRGDETTRSPELMASLDASPDTPAVKLSPDAWSVFRRTVDAIPTEVAGDSAQFRLAGTFFLLDPESEGAAEERGAILDDIEANQQLVVREGQNVKGYAVRRIFSERVLLERDGEELELTLSFKGTPGAPAPRDVADAPPGVDLEDYEEALESNRFGARVGENRWVMSQDALRGYFDELMDSPERIEAIYRALAPERNEEGDITGYRYNKEGEDILYAAAGIQEGDIVRRVNSMNMISQRRAEYFIGEFIQGRMGAVVLDIERDGAEQKLIYLLR